MKYIKSFGNESLYNLFIGSNAFIRPNVSLIEGIGITYNPYINQMEHDYSQDYLTFTATESGTFKFSGTTTDRGTTNLLSYSINGGETWTQLENNTNSPVVNAGEKIMWKSNNLIPTVNGIGKFSSTCSFTVDGNAMSLIYGDNFTITNSIRVNQFRNLFSGCTEVTNAENLSLPAVELTEYCYREMFAGCTNLTTVPKLPATTLANSCYSSMFEGCTSLTTAPELPATTLANSCYSSMFEGCTSLTIAPELPATTLANSCYSSIFEGCTSLTIAPELPATTLTNYCYTSMFYNCTSLNSITCLATDISATNCTSMWVYGVPITGKLIKAASMTSWTTGVNGIPNGWTVQDAA